MTFFLDQSQLMLKYCFCQLHLILSFLIFASLTYSCAQKNDALKKNPTKLTTTKNIRFPGTKLFAELPLGYEWNEEKGVFIFGEKENHLRSMYFPVDFLEMKRGWQTELSRNPGFKFRSFTIEGKEVMTMEGYLKREKKQTYMLMMETDYHPMMLMAQMVDTNLISKMDVTGIIQSLRHDDDFELDLFEREDFRFNENISGFQYYFTVGQKRRTDYLRDRIADMDNLGPERISIYTREKNSEEEIKYQMEGVRKNSLKNATDFAEREVEINGMKTTVLEVDYNNDGKLSYLLYARIRGPEKDFVFRAKTNRDIEEMKDKFRRTLESFEVK